MQSLLDRVFPENEYYRQEISCDVRLASHVYDKVMELRESDDLAGYLSAWPDLVIMHKKSNPVDGTYFVRTFGNAIEVSDRHLSIYKQWYPLDRFLLIIEDSGEGITLMDYIDGKAVKPVADLLP